MEIATTGGGVVTVLCCVCGISIPAITSSGGASATCSSCLAARTDITRGIATECTLHQCRGCQRWHKDSNKWISCPLESRELMALCLQHTSGLQKRHNGGSAVRVTDACWIWTEPHSMRLKVRLTVQREVQRGTVLQQSFSVVYIVRNQQCIECQAEFRQGSWKSLVQVRQRVSHKRTFLYLEQLILKHGAHRGCLSIEAFRDGMDFYFPDKSKASRFMSFLESVCPIKIKLSKKLIGTDDKSNVSNYKYTTYVEICPLCKDDLLYLSTKLARSLGSIARLVLVKHISNVIHVIDPVTGQTASINPDVYWRDPFRPLITAMRSRMTQYVVLGREAVLLRQNNAKRATGRKQRTKLARLTLAKETDLGVNDEQIEECSHLGYLHKSGDVCVGYNLQDTVQFCNDDAEQARSSGKLPDVVIIRKLYGSASTAATNSDSNRIWRLQRLDVEHGEENKRGGNKSVLDQETMDEEDFKREVDADKDIRVNMNLYKNDDVVMKKQTTNDDAMENENDDDDDDDEFNVDDQQVQLDELIDGLVLNDGPDNDDDDEMTKNTDEIIVEEGMKAAQDGIAYVRREDARAVHDKDTAVPVKMFSEEFQTK